jgi:hypothetical protein
MYELQMTRGIVLSTLKTVAMLIDRNKENSQIDEVVFNKLAQFIEKWVQLTCNAAFGDAGLYTLRETHILID